MLNPETIRKDFPIFKTKHGTHPLVYLDNASTSQKPQNVIDSMVRFYESYNANVHRGLYAIAEQATERYEGARQTVAEFIGANPQEIVFTAGATHAINLVASSFARARVSKGDNLVVTLMEHHSNFIPWQQVAKENKAELRVAPITKEGRIDIKKFHQLIDQRTKVVALSQCSNVLGTVNPIQGLIHTIRNTHPSFGGVILVDGAQSVPHMPVDVKELDCDFFVFSGHKMFAATGIGVLYGKQETLERMPPFFTGGHMIKQVSVEKSEWNEAPHKFEAGTQHIVGAISLAAAIGYIKKLGWEHIVSYEKQLTAYLLTQLSRVKGIDLYGPKDQQERLGVVSFSFSSIHPHDLAQVLAQENICVRAGHHCAQPLHNFFGVGSSLRASISFYNTQKEIDQFVNSLRKAQKMFVR